MRAMVIGSFGGTEVFEQRELPRPAPGPGEILVRVMASGTNPVDAKVRAQGAWARIAPPAVLGYEAAGVVEELGAGVDDFKPGDEVFYTAEIFGNARGTYAEYNVVAARIVARKPRRLDFARAAAIPLAGGTAYEAVVERLALRPGETVLIHGGAGGVGSFAVQLAREAGARVLATASAGNLETLRRLGAAVAIDYNREDPTEVALRETDGRGVDAVLDTVGGELTARSVGAVREYGRLAAILTPRGDLGIFSLKNLTLHGIFLGRDRRRLEALARLVDRYQLEPLVDQVIPLAEVARAHHRLDSGHGRGKMVLDVGGS
jgi:NADPH2:quinone reductase